MTVSYAECSARERLALLVDAGSFHEWLPPAQRLTSPHLAQLGLPAAFDDGIAIGRATLAGREVFVAAQEGEFMGGGVGEVHGAKLVGLFRRALRDRPRAVLLLLESGGVRLHEANAGLIAVSEVMRAVLDVIFDRPDWFEVQPQYGRAIICALAHLGGHPVAVVANQPQVLAGSIDSAAADKAAHFILVADSFHLPIVFLADNPGMLPGSRSEREGVLRSGARMFAAQTAGLVASYAADGTALAANGSPVVGALPAPGSPAMAAAVAAGGVAALPAPGGNGVTVVRNSTVVEADGPLVAMKSGGIDLSQIEGGFGENSIKKVGEVVAAHPEEALSIIRTWLHQPA